MERGMDGRHLIEMEPLLLSDPPTCFLSDFGDNLKSSLVCCRSQSHRHQALNHNPKHLDF
jgi:hypothetical protein